MDFVKVSMFTYHYHYVYVFFFFFFDALHFCMCACSKAITGLCVTAYGNTLISGSADATVRVWDISSHQTIKVMSLKGEIFI